MGKRFALVAGLAAHLCLSHGVIAREEHIAKTPGADTRSMPRGVLAVTLEKGFLVVAAGQIGGLANKQNFVLDTGVSPSILNAKIAQKLGLDVARVAFVDAGHDEESGQTVLPDLALGPIRVASLRMSVLDLSSLEKFLGMDVAGLLGMDVLGQASFQLNYERKELTFGEPPSHEGVAVAYDRSAGLALARATVGGNSVRLIVDTGTDRVALYGARWKKTAPAKLTTKTDHGNGLAASMTVREIEKPQLELDGKPFDEVRAYYLPDSSEVRWDGFVGVRALHARELSFDKDRETVYLVW